MDNLSDLVQHAKAGDEDAFGSLIGRFQDALYSLIVLVNVWQHEHIATSIVMLP